MCKAKKSYKFWLNDNYWRMLGRGPESFFEQGLNEP